MFYFNRLDATRHAESYKIFCVDQRERYEHLANGLRQDRQNTVEVVKDNTQAIATLTAELRLREERRP